ncbi:MAG: hypothetical protein ACTS4Z_00930 [Candidatus Hodgkinia cicadicola]
MRLLWEERERGSTDDRTFINLQSSSNNLLTVVPSALVLRLQAPARQMITNAGLDKILIVNKLLQSTESHFDGKFTLWITDLVKVTK